MRNTSGLTIVTKKTKSNRQKRFRFQNLMHLIILFAVLFMLGRPQLSAAETPIALLEALQQRNTEIKTREEKVVEREGRLNLLEKEIRGMLDKYIKLKEIVDQRESERTLALQKEKEARVNRLSKIYQAMDAKVAAQRIKKMKKSTALSLLRKIKEKQAAKILSNMSASSATQFSEAFIKSEK